MIDCAWFKVAAVLGFSLCGGLALADDDPNPIETRIQVTHDAVHKVMRDIEENRNANTLRVPEYESWVERFTGDITDGLFAFEMRMKEKVYPILSYEAGKYNRAALSTVIPADRKEAELATLRDGFSRTLPEAGNEYYLALLDLLFSQKTAPFFDVKFDPDFSTASIGIRSWSGSGKERFKVLEEQDYDENSNIFFSLVDQCFLSIPRRALNPLKWVTYCNGERGNNLGLVSSRYLSGDYAYETLLPGLIKGCKSRVCLDLRANDVIYFLRRVMAEFAQDIRIPLADRENEIVLPSPGVTPFIDWTMRQLSRRDYPESVQNMPSFPEVKQ